MPQSRQKKGDGAGQEVKITLSRRDVIDLLLARRRLEDTIRMIERQLFVSAADLYLGLEYARATVDTIIQEADHAVRSQGFTWNITPSE